MEAHCCEDMRGEVERVCDRHPVRHDCPNALVGYAPRFPEYGPTANWTDPMIHWSSINYASLGAVRESPRRFDV